MQRRPALISAAAVSCLLCLVTQNTLIFHLLLILIIFGLAGITLQREMSTQGMSGRMEILGHILTGLLTNQIISIILNIVYLFGPHGVHIGMTPHVQAQFLLSASSPFLAVTLPYPVPLPSPLPAPRGPTPMQALPLAPRCRLDMNP